jgi:WD40 repeat protein
MKPGIFLRLTTLLHSSCSRYRVWCMAGAAQKGETLAIHFLTDLLCGSENGIVQESVMQVIGSLRSSEAIDCFCHEVMLHDEHALDNIAIRFGFTPAEPSTKAVFYFVTSQKEHLAVLDPEQHYPLLARGYNEAPVAICARVQSVARNSCQAPLFARMMMGSRNLRDTSGWSPEEWDLVIEGIAQESRFEELWSLLFSAPPATALEAMHILQRAGWRPQGDEVPLMEEILAGLPDTWMFPVPPTPEHFSFDTGVHQTVRLAFSPDGSLLASGDCAGTVRIWQTGRGSQTGLPLKGSGSVRLLVFSPDNECLLLCREDGLLCSHVVRDGVLRWSRRVGNNGTNGCYASSREIIVIGDNEGTLSIMEIRTGIQHMLAKGCGISATSLLVLSAGGRIAVGYEDGAVCVLDNDDGSVIMRIQGTGDPVRGLAEGEGTLIVIREIQPPSRYDLLSGNCRLTYTGGKNPPGCFATSGDTSWFSLAGPDHILRIWRNPSHLPEALIPFYNRGITCCTAVNDGSLLISGCTDGTLRSFRMPEGRLLWEKKIYKRAVATITVTSDRSMLASAGWDGTVSLCDPLTGNIIRTLKRNPGSIVGLTFSSSGSYVVCGHANGTATVYDFHDGSVIRSFDLYTPQVKAVSLSPGGGILASAGSDSTLRFWNVSDGSLIAGIDGLSTTARCMVFTPDPNSLISGGWDGKLRLWSVPEGRLLATRAGHTSTISCCAITPDGENLVTGSNDTTIAVWKLPGLERLVTIPGSRSEVSAVAVSTAGDLFAAGSSDSIIRVFRLPSGAGAGTIPVLPGKVTALVFTQNDTALIVGYDTGTIAVFTCPAGRLIHSTGAHATAVQGLILAPNGSAVISAGGEGEIRFLLLPWTRSLSEVPLEEIRDVAEMAESDCQPDEARRQWRFLHMMLTAKYQYEIGLCSIDDGVEAFDFQIAG